MFNALYTTKKQSHKKVIFEIHTVTCTRSRAFPQQALPRTKERSTIVEKATPEVRNV